MSRRDNPSISTWRGYRPAAVLVMVVVCGCSCPRTESPPPTEPERETKTTPTDPVVGAPKAVPDAKVPPPPKPTINLFIVSARQWYAAHDPGEQPVTVMANRSGQFRNIDGHPLPEDGVAQLVTMNTGTIRGRKALTVKVYGDPNYTLKDLARLRTQLLKMFANLDLDIYVEID